MRKQTKKILSFVMSAVMALSLGAGVDMTKASAADDGFRLKAGDVKEARLCVYDNWGGDLGKLDPNGIKKKEVSKISISFDVTGVKETLGGAGLGKMQAFVGVNASDWSVNTLDGAAKPNAIDISEDGSYTVEYASDSEFAIGDQLCVMFWDVLPGLEKDENGIITGPLKFTNVKFTLDGKEYDTAGSAAPSEEPSAAPSEEPSAAPGGAPTADQLVGTAQLDSQANGWCGNEDCTNVKAEINGPGTYVVSSTWDEVQEDPQAYCAMTCADLKDIASYITFSDVTVWVDGKVVDIPVIYGGDKDCRIQLWNTWANDGVGAGCEVPENLPETFYEIKVQFTIGLRETPRDWDAEALDTSLINVDTSKENYEPEKKPEDIDTPAPSPAPVVKNTAKSVKAAKASVSVKKGKKATLTFKVTAVDNKKVVVDKVTATSSNKKVVKVVKVTKKAGKVTVSVKGLKKGTSKVTVKVGSKKATTKVKVK